jgi:hypothetical protein
MAADPAPKIHNGRPGAVAVRRELDEPAYIEPRHPGATGADAVPGPLSDPGQVPGARCGGVRCGGARPAARPPDRADMHRDQGRDVDRWCHDVPVDEDIDVLDVCSYCRSTLPGGDDTFYVDIHGDGGSLDGMFCRREHMIEWFARPLPAFEPFVEEPKAKRVLVLGTKIALALVVAALTVIGGRTVFLFLQG